MARFFNLQRCEGMWMRDQEVHDGELTKVEEIVFADSGLVMSKWTYKLQMLSGDLLMEQCHHEMSSASTWKEISFKKEIWAIGRKKEGNENLREIGTKFDVKVRNLQEMWNIYFLSKKPLISYLQNVHITVKCSELAAGFGLLRH